MELGLLSEEELKGCVISEFNPIRVGFKGGEVSERGLVTRIGGRERKGGRKVRGGKWGGGWER